MRTGRRITLVVVVVAMVVGALAAPVLALPVKLQDDARTSSSAPNTNYGAEDHLSVSATDRSFLKFDLSILPPGTVGSHIAKATLSLWVNRVTTAGSIDVHAVTSSWTEEGLTHNTAPSLAAAEVTAVSIGNGHPKKFVAIDITDLVRDWVDGVITNHGIALVANAAGTDVAFDAKENRDHSHDPRIELTVVAPTLLASGTVRKTSAYAAAASYNWFDVTDLTITLATGARRVLLMLSTRVGIYAGAEASMRFTIDGNEAGGGYFAGGTHNNTMTLHYLTDVLSAGSHTFKVQINSFGSSNVDLPNSGMFPAVFSVMEVP